MAWIGEPGHLPRIDWQAPRFEPVAVHWHDCIRRRCKGRPAILPQHNKETTVARLTQAKMQRWERDAVKAKALIDGIVREQRELMSSAKSARYNSLLNCLQLSKDAAEAVDAVRGSAVIIQQAEARRANPMVTA